MKKKIPALLLTLAVTSMLVFSSPISAKRGDESFDVQENQDGRYGDRCYCYYGYGHGYKYHHYWYFFHWYRYFYQYMYHHGHWCWYVFH